MVNARCWRATELRQQFLGLAPFLPSPKLPRSCNGTTMELPRLSQHRSPVSSDNVAGTTPDNSRIRDQGGFSRNWKSAYQWRSAEKGVVYIPRQASPARLSGDAVSFR
jgi:hypothetical protein